MESLLHNTEKFKKIGFIVKKHTHTQIHSIKRSSTLQITIGDAEINIRQQR